MKPKFELGQIVCLDPTGRGHGLDGKIVGRTEWLDGTWAYVVSASGLGTSGGVSRYHVAECEIHSAND